MIPDELYLFEQYNRIEDTDNIQHNLKIADFFFFFNFIFIYDSNDQILQTNN